MPITVSLVYLGWMTLILLHAMTKWAYKIWTHYARNSNSPPWIDMRFPVDCESFTFSFFFFLPVKSLLCGIEHVTVFFTKTYFLLHYLFWWDKVLSLTKESWFYHVVITSMISLSSRLIIVEYSLHSAWNYIQVHLQFLWEFQSTESATFFYVGKDLAMDVPWIWFNNKLLEGSWLETFYGCLLISRWQWLV